MKHILFGDGGTTIITRSAVCGLLLALSPVAAVAQPSENEVALATTICGSHVAYSSNGVATFEHGFEGCQVVVARANEHGEAALAEQRLQEAETVKRVAAQIEKK